MARQRFIHPEIWKDPLFGKLPPSEQVLFIGLFSIADDEGRLIGEPAHLRSELFAYKDYTNKKVQTLRDSLVQKCANVHLYHAGGIDYIALLKWHEYQKPKYPKASKLPLPFLEDSSILPPSVPQASAKADYLDRVGLGGVGVGKGRAGVGAKPANFNVPDLEGRERDVDRMLKTLRDVDEDSKLRLMHLAVQLSVGAVAKVRESVEKAEVPVGVGWAVNALKSELEAKSGTERPAA